MDIKEQEKIPRIKNDEKEYSRSLMTLHNNEAGRRVRIRQSLIFNTAPIRMRRSPVLFYRQY